MKRENGTVKGREKEGGCTASVFLRSLSGRSLRELAEGALPRDLTPYLPAPSTGKRVTRFFADLGFRAHADATGLTVSIEGSRGLFARVFGADDARLRTPSAEETVALQTPEGVRDLVEEILLLPKPDLYSA